MEQLKEYKKKIKELGIPEEFTSIKLIEDGVKANENARRILDENTTL